MKKLIFTLLIAAWPSVTLLNAEEAPKPLGQAHAHNDYYHKRPLLDALSHGFCSVEADVFLKNGKLLVGHFQFELREKRSLESLYLEPLAKRVKANGGSVHKTKAPFHLMIDFKTDGPKTYAALQPLLEKYRFMLTEFGPEKTENQGGDHRDLRQPPARGDGKTSQAPGRLRRADVRSWQGASPHFMPWISDSWRSHFKWRARVISRQPSRPSSSASSSRPTRMDKNPLLGRTRQPATWAVLRQAGVDFINTDRLEALSKFLRAK